MADKEFTVKIQWGSEDSRREIYENESDGSIYKFKTQAELDAFMEGVDAASGWMDYEVIE